MSNALTPKQNAALAAASVEKALQQIGFKKVMILDLQDGAFTDNGVKVRPHTRGTGVVLKCTSRPRLLNALAQAGLGAVPVKRGGKHWVADPMAMVGAAGLELVVNND